MIIKTYECGPRWDRRIIEIEQKENAGILMSGGLDSWVLYNLLGRNVKIFNYHRTDVIDNKLKLEKLTERTDIISVENNGSNKVNIDYCGEWIMKNYDVSEVYIAANIIPHLAYFPEFDSMGVPGRKWHDNHFFIKAPFNQLYKFHIIDLAVRHNIDLQQTNSCLFQEDRHCMECWQCKERKWGFSQLELDFVGKI